MKDRPFVFITRMPNQRTRRLKKNLYITFSIWGKWKWWVLERYCKKQVAKKKPNFLWTTKSFSFFILALCDLWKWFKNEGYFQIFYHSTWRNNSSYSSGSRNVWLYTTFHILVQSQISRRSVFLQFLSSKFIDDLIF